MTDELVAGNELAFAVERQIMNQPQFEVPVEHEFCHGIYKRTIFLPRGAVLTGLVHKDESFFVILSGVLSISTDDGFITAFPGFSSVTKPGTKRIGKAETDVICCTFHANPLELRANEELVDYLTFESPKTAIAYAKQEVLS